MRPGGDLLYFHKHIEDWIGNGEYMALDRDQHGALARVECMTFKTKTPGLYTEQMFRGWAGYTAEEWKHQADAFRPLHKVRPDGRWVWPALRAEGMATRNRIKANKKRTKSARQKRHPLNVLALSQSRPQSTIHNPRDVGSETNVPSHSHPAESPTRSHEPRSAGAIAGELLARMKGACGAEGS